jgi:hypothetical protein
MYVRQSVRFATVIKFREEKDINQLGFQWIFRNRLFEWITRFLGTLITYPVNPKFVIGAFFKGQIITGSDILVGAKGFQHGDFDGFVFIEKLISIIGHGHNTQPGNATWRRMQYARGNNLMNFQWSIVFA